MRVVHVATFVSDDGAFGGPISVAVAQCRELAARGHEVLLLAGYDGKALLEIAGVSVELFNVQRVAPGFSGLTSFRMLRRIRELSGPGTIFHIHLARDLITLPAAACAKRGGSPTFLQTHGMVMPDNRLRAQLMDKLITRRVLASTEEVFTLTDAETLGISEVAGPPSSTRISKIANGMTVASVPPTHPRKCKEVLFLARLHERKGVIRFAESARLISQTRPDVSFRVVGPDEGQLRVLEDFVSVNGLERVLSYEGAISPNDALDRLAKSGLYVLPSYGEVFPMTVLEAFAVQTPVVLSADCGLAPLLASRQAAFVVDLELGPQMLAEVILRAIDDEGVRAQTVANASALLRDELSIASVVDGLETSYAGVES